VNLNKGLYITCLKTEKLKISRSIVAAIREQNGRFLERDADKGTWYDIGDKKAIEKTSQALREGQPKLRQKMVEMGAVAAAPGQGLSLDQLNGGNGIYTPGGSLPPPAMTGAAPFDQQTYMQMQQRHQHQQQQHQQAMHFQQQQQQQQHQMPPPQRPSDMSLNTLRHSDLSFQNSSITSEMMLQRLSLNSNIGDYHGENHHVPMQERLRPSLDTGGSQVGQELGFHPDQRLSIMSQFSDMGDGHGHGHPQGEATRDSTSSSSDAGPKAPPAASMPPPPPPPPAIDGPMIASPAISGPSSVQRVDRRRVFARMKVNRPPSGRFSGSSEKNLDGMPDIHMVDSQFSLMSNLSSHDKKSFEGTNNNLSDGLGKFSDHGMRFSDHGMRFSDHGMKLSDHGMKFSDHNMFGSRRSLMSGLSRISDASDMGSIFSDLAKKVTNVSTRSLAMSDVSGVEEGLHEDLDESFKLDLMKDPLMDSSHHPKPSAPQSGNTES
jgi:hypothetical protein